jgi:hypothetical protein
VDIAGFFENIAVRRLIHDLKRIECPENAVAILSQCLNKWAIEERGLPQGVLASDILSKVYLESFDRRLRDAGVKHVRYSDDIRAFCTSRRSAKETLVLIIELLRERGLTVQSAKTDIREKGQGLRREFAGAVPAIRALNRDFIDEAIAAGVLMAGDASVPVSVIDDLANAAPSRMNPKVIRRAWRVFVVRRSAPNRSMFRYLLRRFSASTDRTAIEYCAQRLHQHPDRTPEILRYFAAFSDPRLQDLVATALAHGDLAPYPYTRYLMLRWLRERGVRLRARTRRAVRRDAFGVTRPRYLQNEAWATLAELGTASDLDQLAGIAPTMSEPFERAQLLCCLKGLERDRRNALSGRLGREVPWGRMASAYVRNTAT